MARRTEDAGWVLLRAAAVFLFILESVELLGETHVPCFCAVFSMSPSFCPAAAAASHCHGKLPFGACWLRACVVREAAG